MRSPPNSGWLWIALGGGALLLAGGGAIAVYQASANAKKYLPLVQSAAAQYGMPWQLLAAQIQQESNYDPNVISYAGAIGIAQFMPATAASNGVNPYDPNSAIPGMARLMSGYANQYGSWQQALGAYNAGPGAVDSALGQASQYGGGWLSYMPTQTQDYVPRIVAKSGLVLT